MDSGRETIRSFATEMEACLARAKLEQDGIAASVHFFSRYRAMAGAGYVLKVAVRDAARAKQVLDALDRDVDMDEYVDGDDDSLRRCARCHSVNVLPLPLGRKGLVAAILTCGAALLVLKRAWRCRKCGHEWRA